MFCGICGRYVRPDRAQVTNDPDGTTRIRCRGCKIRELQERTGDWFDPDKRHDEDTDDAD